VTLNTRIEHRDGTHAVWHAELTPNAIGLQLRMLRNACYTLVVGLSMMRDSEKHKLCRNDLRANAGTQLPAHATGHGASGAVSPTCGTVAPTLWCHRPFTAEDRVTARHGMDRE
jgi:hypothetical protein